jgi:pilus assembly protein Flp/PilA
MMMKMRQLFARLVAEDSGQDLIEYALVAAIVALSAAAVLRNMKNNVTNVFGTIGNTLTNSV